MVAQRDAWGMVALLSVAAVIAYVDRLILSVLFVPLSQDMSLSDTQVSLLQGASFAVIYAFAGLPLGMAADRWNRRAILIVGVFIWCSATVACGFATNFTELAVARVFVGIGEAALVPAASSMIGDGVRLERRGFALSIFIMGQMLGGGLAVAAGGTLLDLAQSGTFSALLAAVGLADAAPWRVVLWAVGLPGLPLLIALLFIKEPQRAERSLDGDYTFGAALRQLVARRKLLLPLYLTLACAALADFSIGAWTPTLMVREFQWPATQIGLWFGGCLFVSGLVAAALAGFLNDRTTRKHPTRDVLAWALGAAVLALLTTTYALAPDPRVLLSVLFVLSVASSVCSVICIITIQVSLPNELRGVGSALTSVGNMLFGLGLGPTLVALTTDHVYQSPAALDLSIFTVTAPAFVVAAVLLIKSMRDRRQEKNVTP